MGRLGARAVLAARVEARVDRVRFTGGMACTKERIKSGKKLDTVTGWKRRGCGLAVVNRRHAWRVIKTKRKMFNENNK